MHPLKQIKLWALITVAGFVLAVVFARHMIYLGYSYPYNTFLFYPSNRFMDFFNTYTSDQGLAPYNTMFAAYFPLTWWVVFPFTLVRPHVSFIIFNVIFCAFTSWLIWFYIKNIQGIKWFHYSLFVPLFFLSYPLLFALDRGNFENILFIFVSLFLIAFQNQKYYLSSVLLAVAISMKAFPGVFLLLFIKEKQYRALFVCLCLIGVFTLLAFAGLKGGLLENLHLYFIEEDFVKNIYILSIAIYQSASLWSASKVIIWYILSGNTVELHHWFRTLQVIYSMIVVLLFFAISYYVIKIEKTFWKNVAILIFCMIMFPTISYDYKLLYLLPLFLIFVTRNESSQYDNLYFILLSLLFIPKAYYNFPAPLFAPIGNFINIFLMLATVGLIIFEGTKHYRAKVINYVAC